jgi:RNA polymerase sigma factor (TIGR02999 family)
MSDSVGRPSEELLLTVHAELRQIARRQMARERTAHTLQATALVHEAWLALRDRLDEARDDPARFYLAAAESMRRILIDHARRRNAQKRGGRLQKLSLDVVEVAETASLDEVLAIDEAIQRLAAAQPRAADVVRLRFFAGLGEEEAAQALGLSERTVRREWSFARAFLFRLLGGEGPG